MGLSQADVDEVFQNTWLLVHEHVQGLRDPSRLRSWISTTAMRESWRLRRRERPEGGLDLHDAPGDDDDPAEALLDLELRAELQRGLETLRSPCRDLLRELFFTTKQSYEEIAHRLRMPVGSLGPTRARCLADLARYLEGRGLQDPRDEST